MSANLFINNLTIRVFFFSFLSLCFNTAYAQKTHTSNSVSYEIKNLSGLALYQKAKAIKHDDLSKSTLLANAALRKSQDNHNQILSADIHILLGKLAKEAKQPEQSMQEFLKASYIYKSLNDKKSEIKSTVEYANIYISEKRYEEGDKIIEQLLELSQQYGGGFPTAIVLMAKGDSYNKQKRYEDAIAEYTKALTDLTGDDEEIQKRLALAYKRLGQVYTKINKTDESIVFFKKSLGVYTKMKNTKSMAGLLRSLSMLLRDKGNYLASLDYAIRSLEMQRQLDNDQDLAQALTTTGMMYRYLNRYEKSLDHLQEAYLYYKKMNDPSGIAKTSHQIGLIYTRLKQFDQARSFYQVAIDLDLDNEITDSTKAAALREIAVIDKNMGNYDSAKEIAFQAYNIYKDTNDISKESITARIIADIYRAEKNETKAIAYYRRSLDLGIEVETEIYQIKALTPLGEILIDKNIDKAIELLQRSLALSIKNELKPQMLSNYRALHKAEKTRGNTSKSLHYAEKEIELTKIINLEKEEDELTQAKATLESHKMEMELESLREKARLDQLELARKNNELEIVSQATQIAELKLTKNKYSNIALASLLAICIFMVLFIYRRFTDSRKLNKELDYLATHDPLTNCYNRRVLFDVLNRDFTDITLLGEYCIIMADIDHFKAINDIHGHTAGDAVLCGVANILQADIRQNDIVARFGGEEFCILLPGAAQDQGMRIAESMRKKIEMSQFNDIKVTCSFGLTSIAFEAKTPAKFIEQADLALYKSKKEGRNQVTLWHEKR